MHARSAVYDMGKLYFLGPDPEIMGPVQVLIVFPNAEEGEEEQEDPFLEGPWNDWEPF